MSKAERVILWIVWAAVAVVCLGIPLVWFGSLVLRPDGHTVLARALDIRPIEKLVFLSMAGTVVGWGFWTYRRTRHSSR